MKPILSFLATSFLAIAPASSQIAITEFMANPQTLLDSDGEFLELFNYSSDPVNLNGWAISDEDFDNDVISESDLIIPSGSYLVLAKNKAALEGAFFSGLTRPEIIDFPDLTLANGGDEIILTDAESEVIWSVAYPNGVGSGNAAFLSENSFSTTVWGSKDSVGIDFTDIDPASNTLGYQNNDVTLDPNATTIEDDTASPLAGFYTTGSGPVTPTGFNILSIVPGTVDGTYDITFESEDAETYDIELSTDLTDFVGGIPATGTGSETTVTVTPAAGLTRVFYRVRKGLVVVGP